MQEPNRTISVVTKDIMLADKGDENVKLERMRIYMPAYKAPWART